MIIKQYIKDFEGMGFGLFVHFGLYSVLGRGEWAKCCLQIPDAAYEPLTAQFNPKPDWAEQLAESAKDAGCRYITLTTRHHDGFSLYDTRGLNNYDAPHACGRDLVREFTDACRRAGLVPFFYHALLDWREPSYREDFPAYLRYLRAGVELLCTQYGKLGGLWFDGMWDKPEADWEEDTLYALIRKHQPEAMIINNTGMSARGELGNIELDSVTFERGKPRPINLDGAPKYIASEMCEILADHWGYAAEDLNYKSPAQLIRELCECRRSGSNMLLNIGPTGDGSLRPADRAFLGLIGQWVSRFGEAIRAPRPTGIPVRDKPDDFLLRDGNLFYLFCFGPPTAGDAHVTPGGDPLYEDAFPLDRPVRSVTWMDDGSEVAFTQKDEHVTVHTVPFSYGRNLVVRVAKLLCD